MNLNITDWAYGLGGGLLIGLSAALFLLANGRIAGISGILGGLIGPVAPPDRAERLLFLLGLIGAPAIWLLIGHAPQVNATTSPVILIAAGLLVGIGTRMGGGCTSGHGVCGMSRVSPRSIMAALTFILVGVVVVTLGRHVIGGL
ncbi:MAG: YeeE/YedE family protein [Pseudomonadota bacterium]